MKKTNSLISNILKHIYSVDDVIEYVLEHIVNSFADAVLKIGFVLESWLSIIIASNQILGTQFFSKQISDVFAFTHTSVYFFYIILAFDIVWFVLYILYLVKKYHYNKMVKSA